MAAEESAFPEVDTGPASSETLSDAELIAATRAGDAGSFAVLYTRHVDAARACARRLVRSKSEADDLVAEGFAKVLGALRKGKGPDLAFRPYLLTAVRNALYDRTRRDSRIDFTDDTPEPVNAVLLAADYDREDKAMVAQAYAALPERWQMVLWHTDVEGRSPAEVAPLLGISANSVAALAYRAREGLRQAYLAAHVNRGVSESCRSTTEKLSAYVRDGLSARDRRAVQEHLDGCTSCTALLAELQEANRNLKIVLLPVLAGVTASAYLGGLSGGGIARVFRRNPTATAAGAVAAAAAIAFAAVAMASPSGAEEAQRLTVPPIGSGRPTTTTTTTTLPTTTAASTTTTSSTLAPFTPPTFDTAVPPNTYVPFNPNATTVTTVRRYTTTTRPRYTTTTRPRYTTTTRPSSTTTTTTQPPNTATTTTTLAPTTTTPATVPPAAPALTSTVTGLGPVYSGQSAYFSVRVANAASGNGGSARNVAVGPAEGVVVTFNLPAGATFLGASSPDWVCEVAGASVRCLLPRLDAGAATEAIFTLDVPDVSKKPDIVGANFTISPTVVVNGKRVDAKPAARTVADGSKIADFEVQRGAELVVVGNTAVACSVNPPSGQNCDNEGNGEHKVPLAQPSTASLKLGGRAVLRAYLAWQGDGLAPGNVSIARGSSSTPVTVVDSRVADGRYAALADVTDFVTSDGSYTVSGVPAGADVNSYGGWSLMVLVQGASSQHRGVTIALPVVGPAGTDAGTDLVSAKGLAQTATDRKVWIGSLIGEGDRDLTGTEDVRLNGSALAGQAHPIGDAFNSRIVGSIPADFNSYGTDVDVYASKVAGATTELTVSARTTAEAEGVTPDGVTISALALLYDL